MNKMNIKYKIPTIISLFLILILLLVLIFVLKTSIFWMSRLETIDKDNLYETDEFKDLFFYTENNLSTYNKDEYIQMLLNNISKNYQTSNVHKLLSVLTLKNNNSIKSVDKKISKLICGWLYPQVKTSVDNYESIYDEMIYFPVSTYVMEDNLSFENSFNAARAYKGNRKHEGCDIMSNNNISNYYPIISVSDGVVEKIGWLELGGNRVGIRSDSGVYYYYAHLSSYALDINEGDKVVAGQLIGFMGDTGYGKEGTRGKFDVHLHFGIYVNDYAINPYYFLKKCQNNKIEYAK